MSNRKPNTNSSGENFDAATIEAVWKKAAAAGNGDVDRDRCGAIIVKQFHGKVDSPFGWEIDHIKPVSKKGSDDLDNLQPLQWENNRHKGDDYPDWDCKIST